MEPSTFTPDVSGSGARVDSAGTTHVGYVRGRNEDAMLHEPDRGLFVVADGLGGHPAGDVASRIATETLDDRLDADTLADDPAAAIDEAVQAAHLAIVEETRRTPATEGMGTTVVAAWTDGHRLVLGNVGDSRAYHLHDGSLTQLTSDDVFEAAYGRSLTQALGSSNDITTELLDVELETGDRVLLCTDGLTDMVDDRLIADLLADDGGAQRIADRLAASALDHGGYDNVTVIVLIPGDD